MNLIAQIQEVAGMLPWMDYGKGGILAIALWRFETLIKEVRKNGHEVRGLSVALMMETATRSDAEPAIRKFARSELSKMEKEAGAPE